MRKLNMWFLIMMVVCTLMGISGTDTQAADTLSTVWRIAADDSPDNMIGMSAMVRSAAFCKTNNHIYVARRYYDATRKVMPQVLVYNADNGQYIKELNVTGISDHTYPLNAVAVTGDGQIFVCNLSHPGNRAFRIFRYSSETAVPVKIVDDTTLNMTTGEVLAVYGTGKTVDIYASGSGSFKIYKWSTTTGTTFTKGTAITLPIAGYAGSAIAKVNSTYFFMAGNRQPVRFIKVETSGLYQTLYTFPRNLQNALVTYFEVPTETGTVRRFLALGKGYTPGMTLIELKGDIGDNLCDGYETLTVAVSQYARNVNLSATGQIAYDVRNNQLIELVSSNGVTAYDYDLVVANPALIAEPVVTPTSLNFGNVPSGNSSQLVLNIKNLTGTGKTTVTKVTISNEVFTTALTAGTVIAAGTGLASSVTFTPQSENFISATLTIETNAGNLSVALSGRGKSFKISKSLAIADEVIYNNAPAKGLVFKGGSISVDGSIIWLCGQKTSTKQTYVFRSIDGGITFNTFGPITARPANIHGFSASEAVVATTDNIFRTTDGGQTWTAVHTYSGAFFDGLRVVGEDVLIAMGDGPTGVNGDVYLCRSTDHGATWTRLTGIDYKEASYSILTEGCPMSSYGNTVWATSTTTDYAKPFIHKSTDAGVTWVTLAPDAVEGVVKDIRAVAFADEDNGMFVVRRKSDSKKVVYATTNGGTSWQLVTVPTGAMPNAISVIPDAGVFVLGCDSTAAYYTTDLGATWSKFKAMSDVGVNKLLGGLFRNADFGYVFSQENSLLKLKAEAKTTKLWEKAVTTLSFFKNDNLSRSMAYSPVTNHLLVASRTDSNRVRILDAVTGDLLGALVAPAGDYTLGYFKINMVKADDDGVIYLCNLTLDGKDFAIYRYANETAVPTIAYQGTLPGRVGDSFGLKGKGATTILYASGSANVKLFRFVTTDGVVFTESGSITLTVAGLARGGISPVTDAVAEELWVNGAGTSASHITSTGAIIAQNNIGLISSGWHNVLYIKTGTQKLLTLVGKNDAVQGKYTMIFDITNSDSDPWAYDSLGISGTYNANANATGDLCYKDNSDGSVTIFYLNTNNAIAAWKVTTGLATSFLAKAPQSQIEDVSVTKTTILNQNYPNPFNPTTTIEFSLKQDGFIRLSIYNLLGQEVSKVFEGDLSAGMHKFQFDGSQLSSGVYFYRLTTSDYTHSKKMMLMK